MSTSLLNCEVLLSKRIGDYYSSTTTSAGNSSGTTIVDTNLYSYPDNWLQSQSHLMWDMITSGDQDEEERRILSKNNDTLTVLAHGGQIDSAVTYRIHRLYSPTDKKNALIYACKSAFPFIHNRIEDKSLVSGNWLKDGSFEIWTDSTDLTYWNESTVTATQTSTSPYYFHGSYSCKLDTATGYLEQSIDQWDDLKHLQDKSVTFSIRGWCDTASCLRIGVYDGTDTTYSSYHAGDSAWTDDPIEVTVNIPSNPKDISFRVYLDDAGGTAYIDDARVISNGYPRIYIDNLGLDVPHSVSYETSDYTNNWIQIKGIEYNDGYMVLPSYVPVDRRLKIDGIGYLDFLSSGTSSTSWDATVDIDSPQTEILVTYAAIYLLENSILPQQDTGSSELILQALNSWEKKRLDSLRYKMSIPQWTVNQWMFT